MQQVLQKRLYLSQFTGIRGECAVMNILMKTSDFVITLHEIVLGVLWWQRGNYESMNLYVFKSCT